MSYSNPGVRVRTLPSHLYVSSCRQACVAAWYRQGRAAFAVGIWPTRVRWQGRVRYLMTATSLNVVGRTKQVEALAGVYVVVSAEDQTVITMGHRHN